MSMERKVFAREVIENGETKVVKLTQKELFTEILEKVQDDELLTEFVEYQIELLGRKSAKRGKTQESEETKQLMGAVMDKIGADSVSVSQLVKKFLEEDGIVYSPQKLTAILTKLINTNRVEKIVEKRVSYFKKAEEV